jgi:hypothetical protein
MLNPKRLDAAVALPLRVKVNGVDKCPAESLALLQQHGITEVASSTEEAEDGFAFFTLPPRWSVSYSKQAWTVIADGTGKDVLFVFTSQEAELNRPYISIVR